MTKYYKILNNGEIVGYQTHNKKLDYDYLEEISEEDYQTAIDELKAKAQAAEEAAQQEEQTYIEQLEAENAALLFQVLTGEEYSDV